MSKFVTRKPTAEMPRLPLKGSLDLTYRCDNDCRHCWLRLPADSPEVDRELPFEEIRRIVDEARSAGCRRWTISGGEPMIRPDFAEIFDYVTAHSGAYTLVTNGTLITPALARLMKKPGAKLISLYGADAGVHDHITRVPGSFEALSAGIAHLREAGTGFTVQIVPMKDNHHQLEAMIRLAESWSPNWRLGASWLYLSASGDAVKNEEIRAQRLPAAEIVALDPPYDTDSGCLGETEAGACGTNGCGGVFATCLNHRRDFHIDPYGGMSFCCYVKNPRLRRDLKRISFRRIWEELLPAMAGAVHHGPAYLTGCGVCELRPDCRWCPAFAHLEHGDHSARIDYLCGLARETAAVRESRRRSHRRFYAIGGLTLRVDADLPITDETFHPKFELFRTDLPGDDLVSIHHHFTLPQLEGEDLGLQVYRQPPWAVYRKGKAWIYLGIYPHAGDDRIHRVIVFSDDHTRAHIYNPSAELFHYGQVDSLLLLSSDQIVLARVLPALGGAFVHAAGLVVNGRGFLFAGASEAGKSTITLMLKNRAKILCDDRMIVRRDGRGGFRIHGTWSHGDVPQVSPESAPFDGLFFLRQAGENRLERIEDRKAVIRDLLPRFVRPLVTADWWDRVLAIAEDIAAGVPSYNLYFDKSGRIVESLEELAGQA